MRRQYSGEVKYCWPASCCPVLTSHRRNSAFRRPSPCRVMRPVTSACALIFFQLWNCGARVDVGDVLDEGGLIDRREQPAALEVVGDDLRDAGADLGVRRRARHEIRDRDRQRRDVTLGDLQLRLRRAERRQQQTRSRTRAAYQDVTAAQRHGAKTTSWHRWSTSNGSSMWDICWGSNRCPCTSIGRTYLLQHRAGLTLQDGVTAASAAA